MKLKLTQEEFESNQIKSNQIKKLDPDGVLNSNDTHFKSIPKNLSVSGVLTLNDELIEQIKKRFGNREIAEIFKGLK
jgi:hypothetical protein